MSNKTILTGNTSFDTAYFVDDYPYGFTLRCHMKYWIETKASQGQRFISCTSNPKQNNLTWNKPKASTYSAIVIMFINPDNNHVEISHLCNSAGQKELDNFESEYGQYLDEFQKEQLKKAKIMNSAASKLNWTYRIVGDGDNTPVQSKEYQSQLIHNAIDEAVREYKE